MHFHVAHALWVIALTGFSAQGSDEGKDILRRFEQAVESVRNGGAKMPMGGSFIDCEGRLTAADENPDAIVAKVKEAVAALQTGQSILLRRHRISPARMQEIFRAAGLRVLGIRPSAGNEGRYQALVQKADPAAGIETRIFNASVVNEPGKFAVRYFKKRGTGEQTEMLALSDPGLYTFPYYLEGRALKVYLRPQTAGLPIAEPLTEVAGVNYVPQPLTFGFAENESPQRRAMRVLRTLTPDSLSYLPRRFEGSFYPAPDTLLVNARAFFVQLKRPFARKVFDLDAWDVATLLPRLEETAASDGILELNLHKLLHETETPPPPWASDRIVLSDVDPSRTPPKAQSLALSGRRQWREPRWFKPAGSERWNFFTADIQELNAQGGMTAMNHMEYAVSRQGSANQISMLPVKKVGARVWVGLKLLDTPVPLINRSGTTLWSLPVWRVYNGETSLTGAVGVITTRFEHDYEMEAKTVQALGASFRTDPEVSADLIHPYIVEVDPEARPAARLAWLPLDDLMGKLSEIKDARLLITLYRLQQALQQEP